MTAAHCGKVMTCLCSRCVTNADKWALSLSRCCSLGPGCDSLATLATSSSGKQLDWGMHPGVAKADEETVDAVPKLFNKCEIQ